jgi:hypothetical protein
MFVAGVALSLRFGNGATRETSTDTAQAATTFTKRPRAGTALGTFVVKDVDGKTIPIVTQGEPAIIMVSSRTCEWCKQTFSDLRKLANGRPLTHLKLLTLEGASEGAPMIGEQGLKGVQLLGPNDGTDEVFLTFRYPGTPTFLAVDRSGRVSQTSPGYLEPARLRKWFSVMVGDADSPQ